MQPGLIVYQSKYGATKRYAGWLREQTGFDCRAAREAAREAARTDWTRYETIVFAGGVYAGNIAGLALLRRNFSRLQGKKLAVLCVGAAPFDEAEWAALRARNFSGELARVPGFYLRGALDIEALTFLDRALCRMLQKSLVKAAPASLAPWQTALLASARGACDWTDPQSLQPLLAFLAR